MFIYSNPRSRTIPKFHVGGRTDVQITDGGDPRGVHIDSAPSDVDGRRYTVILHWGEIVRLVLQLRMQDIMARLSADEATEFLRLAKKALGR